MYSVQSLCLLRMYSIAWRAVQVVAFGFSVITFGVMSPNRIRSFSVLITCSRLTVTVRLPNACCRFRTR